MKIALFYLFPIAFTIAFAWYTKWQIIDHDDGPGWTKAHGTWHKWGLAMRTIVVLSMLGWSFGPQVGIAHFFLLAPIIALTFDLSLNIVRDYPLFYVGKGGGWDKFIGMWKWVIYLVWILVTSFIIFKY